MAKYLLTILLGLSLVSCATEIVVSEVNYRSFRNNDPIKHQLNSLHEIPTSATVAIGTQINEDYTVDVVVYNLTNKTMTIDRTQSFFMLPSCQTPYYDPQITTHTTTVGSGRGTSVNLGAVAGAVGVGGVVGQALSGVNVGRSSSESASTTTYDVDLPVVHIPPHGHALMGRKFSIKDIIGGAGYSPDENNQCTFGVCIAYSTDRLQTLDNFISQYNMNNLLTATVRKEGKKYYVNEALRQIYIAKPDLFTERYFRLWFGRYGGKDEWNKIPLLYDYQ